MMRSAVEPEEVQAQIQDMGLTADVQANGREASLTVFHDAEREFLYAVRLRRYSLPQFAMADVVREGGMRHLVASWWLLDGHL